MYQKERLDHILQIVKGYGYVTVKYLVANLHYSNATINRDLNLLEKHAEQPYDLIISDILMPDISGIEMAAILRRSDMPAILVEAGFINTDAE